MPATPHIEKHFSATALVRDVVIGMADGLTVPFALAAGLSGAVSSTAIIITAGLAEVAAGAIAMGLGGFLAAQTDLEHYHSELRREKLEIKQVPETERAEVRQVLREQGLDPALTNTVTAALTRDPDRWVNFMMRFELGLEKPEAGRALKSAFTIGRRLCRRRSYTARALFPAGQGFPRASGLDRADSRCPADLRRRQGPIDRRGAAPQRHADGDRRFAGRRRRLRHRAAGEPLICDSPRRLPADHGGYDLAAAADCQFPIIVLRAYRRFELPRGGDCLVVDR